MFFSRETARECLLRLKNLVKPEGIAALTVLIEGTTYLGMFDPEEYYLFGKDELPASFPAWKQEYLKIEDFPAPNDTVKRFCTLVARRPRNLHCQSNRVL